VIGGEDDLLIGGFEESICNRASETTAIVRLSLVVDIAIAKFL
jgi:hypothetical protein